MSVWNRRILNSKQRGDIVIYDYGSFTWIPDVVQICGAAEKACSIFTHLTSPSASKTQQAIPQMTSKWWSTYEKLCVIHMNDTLADVWKVSIAQ